MNGNDVIKKRQAAGWSLARINGSHHMMVKAGKVVPVPVHGKQDLGKGLIASLERNTGIKLR